MSPVRYAGQPVQLGGSPWSQPPKKIQAPSSVASGVYADLQRLPKQLTPRESLARNFGGTRQITVANPATRSGKTTAVNALHEHFRQARTDVIAWDCEGLTAAEFSRERDRLARSYRVLIVDTAGDPGVALDATDQLVVAVDARLESVRAAEAMLADLEATDQAALAQAAIVVVSAAGSAGADPAIARNQGAATAQRFSGRTRAVFVGSDAWNQIAQAAADGL
jgi:hypothetical protein